MAENEFNQAMKISKSNNRVFAAVYLSYLDSVKYFQPDDVHNAAGEDLALRTHIYHELLLGYIEDAKMRGFCTIYIWACPPLPGDDYIMYCHPNRQKVPKSEKLRAWYLKVLEKAKIEGNVVHISNMYDAFFPGGSDHRIERPKVTDLPYLEGDYWTSAAENLLASGDVASLASTSTSNARGRNASKDLWNRLPDGAGLSEYLLARLGETIYPIKSDLLVAHMYHSCSHCRQFMNGSKRYYHPNPPLKTTIKTENIVEGISLENPAAESSRTVQLTRYQLCEKCYQREQGLIAGENPIGLPNGTSIQDLKEDECAPIPNNNDPDPEIDSEFFYTRHQFLSLCQGNHYQFDTLRRARHSSMMVLYHMHNPSEPAFSANCNICKAEISPGQGYRCKECPDFDMCEACFNNPKVSHPHQLMAPDQKKFDETRMRLSAEQRKRRRKAMQESMRLLVHASECRDAECKIPHCMKIKGAFRHAFNCKVKVTGGCPNCRRLWYFLHAHSQICTRANCPVPRCRELRNVRRAQAAKQEDKRSAAYRKMLQQQSSTS